MSQTSEKHGAKETLDTESLSAQPSRGERMMARNLRPVFVMGCHRSGTNLLYDTLLSSGGFAVYRGLVPVYSVLIPRFGKLDRPENRKRMMATWLRSKGFRRAELDGTELTAQVMENCHNGGDFLRIMMDAVARRQQLRRWAVYDPDTVLRVALIKSEIPEALFIHIIRDGRDIALSLRKMGGFNPFPWTRKPRGLEETALYWEWMVQKGRAAGRAIPEDYAEIRYEDLVGDPRGTFKTLSQFLDHDLDYDQIRSTGLGRLSETNSSFREESEDVGFNPVQRWKERLSPEQVASLEWHIGGTLEEVGYARAAVAEWKASFRDKCLRAIYPSMLGSKYWVKMHTPLGRFSSLAELELNSN